MEQLRCVVERITYQNEENGYSVIKVRAKGFNELVTAVGNMPEVHVGSVLVLGGSWKVNPKFGRQFCIETYEETLPATALGIEKYLGSGLVKGIGPKFARKIVKQFGADTLNIIEDSPERLIEVSGIGQLRVNRIKESWQQQKEIKNIMLFLQGHNVSTSHATKIYKAYGNDSIKIVRENPYRMADDIWGIGFRTADMIAGKLGFEHDKYVRLRSGLIYTLNRLADDGHCFATRSLLVKKGAELLDVEEDVLHMTLDEMIRSGDVVTEKIQKDEDSVQDRKASVDGVTSGKSHTETESSLAGTGINPAGSSVQQGNVAMRQGNVTMHQGSVTVQQGNVATQQGSITTQQGSITTQQGSVTTQQSNVATQQGSVTTGSQPQSDRTQARLAAYRSAAESIAAARAAADEYAIYLPPFYFCEAGTAKRLLRIYSRPASVKVNSQGLADRVQKQTGMTYDAIQIEAIEMAVRSKILVLTGGPGTGKTTTTLGIISAFREAGAHIVLAAPTGRAAKRLSEATGLEAKTIHRLLEAKPPEGYQRNEENPVEGDVLIVDECSMIDIMLMYNLLKAIPDDMTLILVGDIDQLPSVGAGNVLRDIISSGKFPVVRLTRIFRQAQASRIIMNAHRINSGQRPDLSNGSRSDFFFAEKEDAEEAASTIVDFVKNKLPKYYHVRPSDIQVLTPMQKGNVGAANLNQMLQEAINPGREGIHRGGFIYKAGDKVMQIRNNYDKEVFNGDIGVVESADTEDLELKVLFDDRLVTYDISELDELVLAYATTIHKSQGSEYPIVVMPLLMQHYVMLQRNLVYTGITRAKKILVIVGTKKALDIAINNVTVTRRNTMLKERLAGAAEQRGSSASAAIFKTAGRKTEGDRIGGGKSSLEAASSGKALIDKTGINKTGTHNASVGNTDNTDTSVVKVNDGNASVGNTDNTDTSSVKVSDGNASAGNTDNTDTSSVKVSDDRISSEPQDSVRSNVPAEEHGGSGSGIRLDMSEQDGWLKEDLFVRIARSSFRSSFRLKQADRQYIAERGMGVIRTHAAALVQQRLAPAEPKNDGRQTPMRGAPKGHPIFLGQHATGTCCRGCLLKWHGIPKGRQLTEKEQAYVVDVLMKWVERQLAED